MTRERERERERPSSDWLTCAALVLLLGTGGVALAQDSRLERVSLAFDETDQIGGILFGQGVTEVMTESTGITTAGGRITWVKYFEQTDHLGMHHVYYRQQYRHPHLSAGARITGTSVALHFAPEGELRWVEGKQVADVLGEVPATVRTRLQAFDRARVAAASWPGFTPGDPSTWPPGTLAELRDHVEVVLTLEGDGRLRPRFQVPMLDIDGGSFVLILDASTGSLEAVRRGTTGALARLVDCSPDRPQTVDARVRAQDDDLYNGELRPPNENVNAHPWADDNETNCGADGVNTPCTHEAVWSGIEDVLPQIEVYHGSAATTRCRNPTWTAGSWYMRVGLKEDGGDVTYDLYPEDPGNPDKLYRRHAGDAMLFTRRTMETFAAMTGRCSFDGSCGIARVVVDTKYCYGIWDEKDGAAFQHPDTPTNLAPTNAVTICPSSDPGVLNTMSAAQDIVAHEWGHGVSKFSPVNFYQQCLDVPTIEETCEMSEGFADFVGHWVEHATQPDGDWEVEPEVRDWVQGEDWNQNSKRIRRADELANLDDCSHPDPEDNYRESIHADDGPLCQRGVPGGWHSAGNRLSVVYMLLSEGGTNPGCSHFGNCDVSVAGGGLGYWEAAKILFRVLTVQADQSTADWNDLPYLAMQAAYDEYYDDDPPCALDMQRMVRDAFEATGYPETGHIPYLYCNLIGCPPNCGS